MPPRRSSRRRSTMDTLGAMYRGPLRRAQIAFAAMWAGERAFMVSLAVVAFRDGGVAAVVTATDGPPAATYGFAIVATVAVSLFRPAHSALLPALAKFPEDLTRANAVRGMLDSLATPGAGRGSARSLCWTIDRARPPSARPATGPLRASVLQRPAFLTAVTGYPVSTTAGRAAVAEVATRDAARAGGSVDGSGPSPAEDVGQAASDHAEGAADPLGP